MSVSRRGFLASGVVPLSGALLGARGLEAYLADAQVAVFGDVLRQTVTSARGMTL
jgi:hypothetical protein